MKLPTFKTAAMVVTSLFFLSNCKGDEGGGGGGGAPEPTGAVAGSTDTSDSDESEPVVQNFDVNGGTTLSFAGQPVISGSCKDGTTIELVGDVTKSDVVEPAGSLSLACTNGSYSFTLSLNDGEYNITVKVKDSNGDTIESVHLSLAVDTVAPASPKLTNPPVSPYSSGDSSLTVEGECEEDAVVEMTGDENQDMTCTDDTFSFVLTAASDGVYSYSFTQTDAAGNKSSATVFDWNCDSSLLATPAVTNPATTTVYTKVNSLTIDGNCAAGSNIDVKLGGDVIATDVTTPTGLLTTGCGDVGTAEQYRFVVEKASEGEYSLSVSQEDTTIGLERSSGSKFLMWVYDATLPSDPVYSDPPASSYTASGPLMISGVCEPDATVNLTGDRTDSVICSSESTYSFEFDEASDQLYNYTLSQTDKADNTSVGPLTLAWTRDSTMPSTPTITTPMTDPLKSNRNTITIAGSCETGLTVSLGGNVVASEVSEPNNSLTQTCSDSSYSFTIDKSSDLSDATYDFTLKQTDGGVDSGLNTQEWQRDITEPDVLLDSTPPATNLNVSATFEFSSTDPTAEFQCRLDNGSWQSCSSPLTYANMTNGNYVFDVRAQDPVGNVSSTPQSFSWSQGAHNTVALYHFDSGVEADDSSNYASSNLIDSLTAAEALGKFNEARTFEKVDNDMMTASDHISHSTLTTTMTIDLWYNTTALDSNKVQTLIMKGADEDYGFKLAIKAQGGSGKGRLIFSASPDGTNAGLTTVQSSVFAMSTASWHHIALVWNKGSVNFYYDGVAIGTATIGTAGATILHNSTANLTLGRDTTATNSNSPDDDDQLAASLDEVRLSQKGRWIGSFTPPTSPHTPD